MSENKELFEETVSAIRAECVDPATEDEASRRTWERLARPATREGEGSGALARIEGCEDFQSLIPDFLSGRLSDARRQLLEDHTGSCLPCRRALKAARSGAAEALPSSASTSGKRETKRVFAVAAAVAAVALGSWLWMGGYLSPPEPRMAQVRAIEGDLLLIDNQTLRPLSPGDWVAEGASVRTTKGSTAVLGLGDGSAIEVAERSQLSVAERRRQTTIRVSRGDIIVEAADQRSGELLVATEEVLVSVKGTIFAVSHGAKGSLVAVVEGEVQVESGREERLLFPGEQFSSNLRLGRVPFESAIGWSQDADRYFELLAELRDLRRELATVSLAVDLRYESRFLDVVPDDSVVYASLPNPGSSLQEVRSIVAERLDASDTLREWWEQNLGGASSEADQILDLLEAVASELGEEIVLSAAGDLETDIAPLVLAELSDPASFEETLREAIGEISGGEAGNLGFRFLVDPLEDDAGDDELLFWIDGDVLAGSSEIRALRQYARASRRGSGFVGSDFHAALAAAYAEGTELMVGVDVSSVIAGAGADAAAEESAVMEWSGIRDAKHLIVDSKTVDDLSQTAAALSFSDRRQGVMAWLAEPAAMGSLDYVSADASAASAFLFKDPIDIVDEVFALLTSLDPEALASIATIEEQLGVDLRADLAAPLGGEVSVALDGPLLPEPSWKMVVEVYDPARLQSTIELLLDRLAEVESDEGETVDVSLSTKEAGGRTYYQLSLREGDGGEVSDVHYTYDAGFLLAAPSRALLDRGLQARESRYGLLDSAKVRALMPSDSFLNFSGLVYQDVGSELQPLLDGATQVAGQLSEEQQALISEISEEALSPTLLSVYGEPRAIRVVATMEGEILGGALSRLFGAGQLLGLSGILQDVEETTH